MSKSAKIIVFSAILAFCSTGFANVLLVPNPYPTIQSAINAAVDGDTVIVAPGTYTGLGNRNIDFLGKAITVRSENGPENCIIDCQNSGRGFYFHTSEGPNSVLDGLTITNGIALPEPNLYGWKAGGAGSPISPSPMTGGASGATR